MTSRLAVKKLLLQKCDNTSAGYAGGGARTGLLAYRSSCVQVFLRTGSLLHRPHLELCSMIHPTSQSV